LVTLQTSLEPLVAVSQRAAFAEIVAPSPRPSGAVRQQDREFRVGGWELAGEGAGQRSELGNQTVS